MSHIRTVLSALALQILPSLVGPLSLTFSPPLFVGVYRKKSWYVSYDRRSAASRPAICVPLGIGPLAQETTREPAPAPPRKFLPLTVRVFLSLPVSACSCNITSKVKPHTTSRTSITGEGLRAATTRAISCEYVVPTVPWTLRSARSSPRRSPTVRSTGLAGRGSSLCSPGWSPGGEQGGSEKLSSRFALQRPLPQSNR